MQKINFLHGDKADNQDLNKSIKNVSDQVDANLKSAGGVTAVFSSQSVSLRVRLRDLCEKVVLTRFGSNSQRIEDILWKKVYYGPLAVAKKLRKGTSWSENEAVYIYFHLNDGLAYYHHLLQCFSVHLQSHDYFYDFVPPFPGIDKQKVKSETTGKDRDTVKESIFHCLTCLGDLSRYIRDLGICHVPQILPIRYYLQALHYNSDIGLTHSNLATFYASCNYHLLASIHYLKAKPFEGAEGNLKRMISQIKIWNIDCNQDDNKIVSSKDTGIKFLQICLLFIECLFSKHPAEEVAAHCQEILVCLDRLLVCDDENDLIETNDLNCQASHINGHSDALTNGSIDTKEQNCFLLTPVSMVNICSFFMLCVEKMKKQGSVHTSRAELLLVCILLTLITHVNSQLEQRISLVDPAFLTKILPFDQECEEIDIKNNGEVCNKLEVSEEQCKEQKKKKSTLAMLRRKKIKACINNVDEDSDSDVSVKSEDAIVSVNSSDNEQDLVFSQLCLSDEEESDLDVKVESDQEWAGMSASEHLQILGQEGLFAPIYIALEWLSCSDDILKMCFKSASCFWESLAKFLNLIKVDIDSLKGNSQIREAVYSQITSYQNETNCKDTAKNCPNTIVPLPEKFQMHSFFGLLHERGSLELKNQDLVLYRVMCIQQIGQTLISKPDSTIKMESNIYKVVKVKTDKLEETCLVSSKNSTPTKPLSQEDKDGDLKSDQSDSKKLLGMQSLTAQWLQHEVKRLEERTNRRVTLSVYLVPDATALINYLGAMKTLVAKSAHMVIIPQTVVDSLDQQKRDSIGAREAIRWLEVKFRHGSRFIRAQRPHERSKLPYIKYPKRKDREAWDWYQVMECCYYLSTQIQHRKNTSTAVTLLMGGDKSQVKLKSFSPLGVAHAAGIVVENIEEFLRKWQTSIKGHS